MQFITSSGRPVQPLLALADLFGVEHDGTTNGLNEAIQREWYQGRTIRADIIERHGSVHRAGAFELLRQLGCVEEVPAPRRGESMTVPYWYVLLMGGTLLAVRRRFRHLLAEWEDGVNFMQLVLMGSKRLLRTELGESLRDLLEPSDLPHRAWWQEQKWNPQDESGMMECVFQQYRPREWEQPQVVRTPFLSGNAPNTRDVAKDWLKTCPAPGACLVVSSQPYVTYQQLVVRSVLPAAFTVDACGPAVANEISMTTLLDNAAKQLFEEVGSGPLVA